MTDYQEEYAKQCDRDPDLDGFVYVNPLLRTLAICQQAYGKRRRIIPEEMEINEHGNDSKENPNGEHGEV